MAVAGVFRGSGRVLHAAAFRGAPRRTFRLEFGAAAATVVLVAANVADTVVVVVAAGHPGGRYRQDAIGAASKTAAVDM
eukprot:365806-Chlamydomonas_euryale.AAC.10